MTFVYNFAKVVNIGASWFWGWSLSWQRRSKCEIAFPDRPILLKDPTIKDSIICRAIWRCTLRPLVCLSVFAYRPVRPGRLLPLVATRVSGRAESSRADNERTRSVGSGPTGIWTIQAGTTPVQDLKSSFRLWHRPRRMMVVTRISPTKP